MLAEHAYVPMLLLNDGETAFTLRLLSQIIRKFENKIDHATLKEVQFFGKIEQSQKNQNRF